MKEPYFMLSLLIPGPHQPGNEIDIYLKPLVDKLKELWEEGVETYDAYNKEHFQMRASLLWTIHDYLGLSKSVRNTNLERTLQKFCLKRMGFE